MKNKLYIYSSLILIFLSFCLGSIAYPLLPSRIASHWNYLGQVDGYSSKFWGIFLLPIIMLVVFVFMKFFQKLDPKSENIKKFEGSYNSFLFVFNIFFFIVFLFTLLWSLGIHLYINKLMALLLAFLFYSVGNLMKATKQNYFIGIRTPWTLHNETVWNKTNTLGGKLFQVVAGLSLVGLLYPNYLLALVFIPLIVVMFYIYIYSYLEFKKL